jgi:hypothetical protein
MRPNSYDGIEDVVGKIGFIQEPGLKLRSVANPYPIFQILLSRMGNTLYDSLKRIEEDCTFDQDKGIKEIQGAMRDGIPLMSIDLSSATDRFPLSYTRVVMEVFTNLGFITREDLDLWLTVSTQKWAVTKETGCSTVRWNNGQPLGVFPSFAAFAISHHILARSTHPTFYRILGDDIVIDRESGLKLKEKYRELGLIISEDKSLDSPILSEFGGRLITKDRVFAQPKYRDISDRSFIDLVRALGPRAIGMLPTRQKKVLKLLAEVPRDASHFGMGWNKLGKSYNQRMRESINIIEALQSDDYMTLTQSSLSDTMDRLKSTIMFRENSDFKTVILKRNIEESAEDFSSPNWTLEARILHVAGVTQIKSLEIVPGWGEFVRHTSDPRGKTTLEILESKLKGVTRIEDIPNVDGSTGALEEVTSETTGQTKTESDSRKAKKVPIIGM